MGLNADNGAASARQRPALALNVRGALARISSNRIGCGMWFAGNHSDVGGSYPESETRQSDISLGWMAHAAQTFPDRKGPDGFGIKVHDSPQHMRARCGSGCTRKDLSERDAGHPARTARHLSQGSQNWGNLVLCLLGIQPCARSRNRWRTTGFVEFEVYFNAGLLRLVLYFVVLPPAPGPAFVRAPSCSFFAAAIGASCCDIEATRQGCAGSERFELCVEFFQWRFSVKNQWRPTARPTSRSCRTSSRANRRASSS